MQTFAKPRTLKQMQFCGTAYEVVAKHIDGREIRLAFTERHTKSALLRIAHYLSDEAREAVFELLGDWDGEASYTKSHGWKYGPVYIRFSGLTERDCANNHYANAA